jgi:vacuolar-type H+-ATPase subunit I/STV1
MSGPYPPQGPGGHGLKHTSDHGHVPEEEVLKEVGNRAYQLKPHEKANIKNIESSLRSGKELSHKELHEYMHYLDEFSHELKEILQSEKAEEISNIQLERDLRKVAQLMGEISTIMERSSH